jgi:hypothetical protein
MTAAEYISEDVAHKGQRKSDHSQTHMKVSQGINPKFKVSESDEIEVGVGLSHQNNPTKKIPFHQPGVNGRLPHNYNAMVIQENNNS